MDFQFLDPGELRDREVQVVLMKRNPADPAKGWVASYDFDIRVGGETVGIINYRAGDNISLQMYGGHFAYRVYEKFRGHHYAERGVRLLLPFARRHGLQTLWITCNPDNFPSRRTCERLGATLVEIVSLPPENDQYIDGEREKCRYRIDLSPQLPMVELTSRVADADVAAVWSLAAPDPQDLAHRKRVLALYPPAGTRRMFGFELNGKPTTTCGVSQHDNGRITVHQMATLPAYRRHGLARALLFAIFAQLDPRLVECSTDAPNDHFYRACGFETISEGFPPTGIERFRCRFVRTR